MTLYGSIRGTASVTSFSTPYRNSKLTLFHLQSDGADSSRCDVASSEDAFVAVLQVNPLPRHDFWIDGKHRVQPVGSQNSINIFDLNAAPYCEIGEPVDNLHLHIPRASLDDLADELEVPTIDSLSAPFGWETSDPVAEGLKVALLAGTQRPAATSRLFIDHAVLALHMHVAGTYGNMTPGAIRQVGGLAPWQERTAKEMIAAHTNADLSLADVANAVGLSVAHFSRAFKKSAGLSPHQWLLQARVDTAKTLLADPDLTLAQVALRSGFSDQSHLTKVFSRMAGTTPGSWRRYRPSPNAS